MEFGRGYQTSSAAIPKDRQSPSVIPRHATLYASLLKKAIYNR